MRTSTTTKFLKRKNNKPECQHHDIPTGPHSQWSILIRRCGICKQNRRRLFNAKVESRDLILNTQTQHLKSHPLSYITEMQFKNLTQKTIPFDRRVIKIINLNYKKNGNSGEGSAYKFLSIKKKSVVSCNL